MQRNNDKHGRNRLLLASLSIFSILIVVLISSIFLPSAQAETVTENASPISPQTTTVSEGPLCRYGIAASEAEGHIVPAVGAGWFLKFNWPIWYGQLPDGGAEQAHVIKTFQVKNARGDYLPDYTTSMPLNAELAAYIQANPGGLWIIGNEVDRGPQPGQIEGGQGDMYPDMYAVAYHDVSAFIKRNDPTARIAISALVEVTPGRLQYLDRVWNAYKRRYNRPMAVDIWNMHLYALPEVQFDGVTPSSVANVALGTDPTLGKRGSGGNRNVCADADVYCQAEHDDMSVFAEQVLMMRQWMKDHGQQQKPLILSEFSILYGYAGSDRPFSVRDEYGNYFTPERVSAFMRNAFDYLNEARDEDLGYTADDNRLVQQWLWFAAYTNWGSSSDLVQADLTTLTMMGRTFRDYVAAEEPVANLTVDVIPRSVAVTGDDGTATALLTVPVRNGGNTAVNAPFRVTFYADADLTRPFASVIVSSQLRGCAMDSTIVQGKWQGLPPGLHTYWVHVDSDGVIDEQPPGEAGNIAKGIVLVHTNRALIPAIGG